MKVSRGILAACLTLASFSASSASADVVIVEARAGGINSDKASVVGVFPNGWNASGSRSTVAGLTSGIGSWYNSATGVGGDTTYFQVAPILEVAGGEYDVEITHQSGNAGASVLAGIIITGGTGLPAETTAFSAPGANTWELVGRLKLDPGVTTPTIRFTERANDNRFYADAVRFTLVPEPASLSLLALGGLALARRRRKA